jgi:predicted double-glycine peptidase
MLFNIIKKTKTVICNGYEGIFPPLQNISIISKKETESLNKLKKYMDVIIHLK